MDRLADIFEKQQILQARLGYDIAGMCDEQRAAYIKEYAQHADHEMHEMLAEIPFFKSWKSYSNDTELNAALWEAAQEEFVDAMHFMVNVGIGLGFDAELLHAMYMDKNSTNHTRQEDTLNYKPCVQREVEECV